MMIVLMYFVIGILFAIAFAALAKHTSMVPGASTDEISVVMLVIVAIWPLIIAAAIFMGVMFVLQYGAKWIARHI